MDNLPRDGATSQVKGTFNLAFFIGRVKVQERVGILRDFFTRAKGFEQARVFVSRGQPRPKDDTYYHLDQCPYVVRGGGVMDGQGNRGMSYR
jgi:hypothetical protein